MVAAAHRVRYRPRSEEKVQGSQIPRVRTEGGVIVKLFVWNEPYHVHYGSSLLFAVAETEEEARAIVVAEARHFQYGRVQERGPGYPPELVAKLGAPRVVDLPCAEFHEWAE